MPKGGRGGLMLMMNNGRFRLTGTKQPISAITDMLSNQLGRPVVDMTGLTGKYDYTLEFLPEEGQMMKGPMGGLPPPPPPPPGAGPAPGDNARTVLRRRTFSRRCRSSSASTSSRRRAPSTCW